MVQNKEAEHRSLKPTALALTHDTEKPAPDSFSSRQRCSAQRTQENRKRVRLCTDVFGRPTNKAHQISTHRAFLRQHEAKHEQTRVYAHWGGVLVWPGGLVVPRDEF